MRIAAELAISLFSQAKAYDFRGCLPDDIDKLSAEGVQLEYLSHSHLIVYPTLCRRRLELDGYFGESIWIYEGQAEDLNF